MRPDAEESRLTLSTTKNCPPHCPAPPEMTTTLSNAASTSLLAEPLALRRSGSREVLLNLQGEKITVGSGQSCVLRLSDTGVRPLHCLISVSEQGTLIRRWAEGTLLNGQPFTEAYLQGGDCLTVGPVDLVVEVSEETPDQAAKQPPQANPLSNAGWTAAIGPVAAATNAPAPTESAVNREAIAQQRQRARRLLGELRRARDEAQQLKTTIATFNEQIEGLQSERTALQQQRDELVAQLERLTEELSATREELTRLSDSQKSGEVQFMERLAELEQQVLERNDLVLDLRTELEVLRDELNRVSMRAATVEPEQASPEVVDESTTSWSSPAEVEEPELDLQAEGFVQATEGTADEPAEPVADYANWNLASPSSDEESSAEASEMVEEQPIAELDSVQEAASYEEESNELWGGEVTPSAPVAKEETEEQSEELTEDLWGSTAPAAEPEEPAASDDDLWGTGTSAEVEDVAEQPVGEPEQAANLWDIEVQTATPADSAAMSLEQPIAEEVAEEVPAAAEELSAPVDVDPTDTLSEEEDLWGRINDLRAVASDRLHHEVETDFLHGDEPAVGDDLPIDTTSYMEAEPASEVEVNDLPTGPTTLFDPPAEEEASEAKEEPVSFVEKYKHLLEEDGAADVPVQAPEPVPVAVAQPSPDMMASADDDEESIEEYMAKMMARLRGESDPAPAAKPEAAKSEPAKAVVAEPAVPKSVTEPLSKLAKEVAISSDDIDLTPEQPMECLSEMKTSNRPAAKADMAALRDLANSSARQAIKTANSKKARENASSSLMMSAIGVLAGAYLVWSAQGEVGMALIGGAFALGASLYWTARTAKGMWLPDSGLPKHPKKSAAASDEPLNNLEANGPALG